MGRFGPRCHSRSSRRDDQAISSIRRRERVLGVGIVGAGAGEMIAEGVLAIEMAALAKDIALTIHPHPTISETVMESAEVFFGTSTHIYRPKRG